MKTPATTLAAALGLGALGVALAAAGIAIGEADDAPGAALLGLVLMTVLVGFGIRLARRKTPNSAKGT